MGGLAWCCTIAGTSDIEACGSHGICDSFQSRCIRNDSRLIGEIKLLNLIHRNFGKTGPGELVLGPGNGISCSLLRGPRQFDRRFFLGGHLCLPLPAESPSPLPRPSPMIKDIIMGDIGCTEGRGTDSPGSQPSMREALPLALSGIF